MKLETSAVRQVAVAEITVGPRVRALDENAVALLHLRRVKGGYALIDGLHRLTVAKRSGLETVPALVWDCRADEAKFMEVDANLSIAHLQPIDVAVNLAARKASYEELFPETKQGAAATASRLNKTTNLSFSEYTAKVLGLSRRQVERIVAAGESVTPDEARWIRGAPRRANYSDLEAVRKTPPGHDRSQAIIVFSNGKATSLRAALQAIRPDAAAPQDPVETALKGLLTAWSRAPLAARRRFVAVTAEELDTLLGDEAGA